jgi:phage gp36-like protein
MPVSYCLPADIRSNVAGTDAGTGTCAMLEDAQLSAAIAKASAKVSSYAGTAWFVDANDPVIVIPDLIVTVTVQLATFYATLTYRKGKVLQPGDPVLLGYQDAIATLKDIVSGLIEVVPVPPADAISSAGKVINKLPAIFSYDDAGVLPDGRGGVMVAGAPGSRLIDGWQ